MNLSVYAQIFVAALFSKAASFSFQYHGTKYNVTMTAKDHTVSLGRLSFDQAAALSKIVATIGLSLSGNPMTVRLGNQDATVTITPVSK